MTIDLLMIAVAMYLLWWSAVIYVNVLFKASLGNGTPRIAFATSCILPLISTILIYNAVNL